MIDLLIIFVDEIVKHGRCYGHVLLCHKAKGDGLQIVFCLTNCSKPKDIQLNIT